MAFDTDSNLPRAEMPVCITGMHRSGTSMVAQILHCCGLYIGPEQDLIPADPHNADGHWENVNFADLNDALLSAMGGGWDRPPVMADGWQWQTDDRLRARADALHDEFRDHEPWGWKDPRTSLTLPFWKTVIPQMQIVVCLRNPLEVALSLRRRGYSSYSFGLGLWKIYHERLLESTRPDERIVTHYDSYFATPETEIRRLLDSLGLATTDELVHRAVAIAKTNLRHSQITTQQLLDANVAPDVVQLYLRWNEEAHAPVGSAHNLAPGSLSAASNAEQMGKPTASMAERENDSTQDDSCRASGKPEQLLDVEALEVEVLRQEMRRLRPWAKNLQKRIGQLQQELDDAGRTLTLTQEQLETGNSEQEVLRKALAQQTEKQNVEREAINKVLAQQTTRLDAIEESLHNLREQSVEHHEELQTTLYDIRADVAVARAVTATDNQQNTYPQLLRRIREIARTHLPRNATVLVANKGDEEMLKLYGRRGWHFPRTEDGGYAGYYPHSGNAAIAQLEWLRARGADFFLIPETAKWWLQKYPEFRNHLERRYRVRVRQEGAGVVFALREPSSWSRLYDFLTECQSTRDHDPSILDWNSGSDLAERFPEYDIFLATSPGGLLPYLDQSIDVVAVGTTDERTISEARRVAKKAIVIASRGGEADRRVEVLWQDEAGGSDLPTASIIVTAYNKVTHTKSCLASLLETLPSRFQGEIIVVITDAEQEATVRLEAAAAGYPGVRIVRPKPGEDSFSTTIRSASEATGEITVFVQNDTVALPGWLLPILRTFRDRPCAGVVGPQVLFPDGAIKEAGGAVVRDGAVVPLGQGDRGKTQDCFDFLREVGYCTTACLATRHSLFLKAFDPGYCTFERAAVDYCSKLRAMEFNTYYQPESVVVQSEAVTRAEPEFPGAETREPRQTAAVKAR